MSLYKAIKHRKEYRKPYYGSKRFDSSCRTGGDCPYCVGSRLHSVKKQEQIYNARLLFCD